MQRNLISRIVQQGLSSRSGLFCSTFHGETIRNLSPSAAAYNQLTVQNSPSFTSAERLFSPKKAAFKAVVFDKDGTLICLHTLWVPWARNVANNICKDVNLDVSEEIFNVLGVCTRTLKVKPGILAEGTNSQIAEVLNTFLIDRGVNPDLAKQSTSTHIQRSIYGSENLTQLHDLKDMFTVLRQHDIRVGMCTSDSRASTIATLKKLDVLHLVDVVMCGDDPDGMPKPNPHNAKMICDRLQVKPEEAVMVGDSATDMQFAKNGEFGLAVGVLSGTALREQLEDAWQRCNPERNDTTKLHIIPSVADIIPVVLPDRTVPVHMDDLPSRGKCKLVILDKNGSLTNIYPRWSRWAEKLSDRLEQNTSKDISLKFMDILGYSMETRRVTGGLLTECSMVHIREAMSYLLLLNGYGIKQTEAIVDAVWFTSGLESSDLLPGVVETLKEIHASGLILALNTSDNRAACESFLDHAGLRDKFSLILCAEDAGQHPKPLPHTVYRIMEEMKCEPNQVVVVGDCPGDLIAGKSAGVNLTVGLLSGFSLAHNLLPHATFLMPNITYLPEVLKNLQ